MMLTLTPLGVAAEKSCSRSGYCAGQRLKMGWSSSIFLSLDKQLLNRGSQRRITTVQHKHRDQFRWLGVTGIATDRVNSPRIFRPALSGVINARFTIIHLGLD